MHVIAYGAITVKVYAADFPIADGTTGRRLRELCSQFHDGCDAGGQILPMQNQESSKVAAEVLRWRLGDLLQKRIRSLAKRQ